MWTTLGTLAISFASLAPAGSACSSPESRQFDFWLGDWRAATRSRGYGEPGGFADSGELEIRVSAILGGCALVEEARRAGEREPPFGYSLRFFNPATGRWHLVLNWPEKGKASFVELAGGFRHGRGEFFRTTTSAAGGQLLLRFSFSDIAADRLRWDAAAASPGWGAVDFAAWDAEVWFTAQIFEFTRRTGRLEPQVLRGTALGTSGAYCRLADGPRLAPMLGHWQGSRRALRSDGTWTSVPAEARLVSLAGGCLLEERLTISGPEDSGEHYAVMGFDTDRDRWVRYSLAGSTLELSRLEGRFGEEGWRFEPALDAPAEPRKRLTRVLAGPDRLVLSEELSSDNGRTWSLIAVTTVIRQQ